MPRPSFPVLLAALALLLVPAAASAGTGPATCPGTFKVLHNDRIGSMRLPAGSYRIETSGGLGCAQAASLFSEFLKDFDGVLPSPWRAIPGERAFSRGNGPQGFGVTRVGRVTRGGDRGEGSGTHPSDGSFCPNNPFRVLNNDRIGRLSLPRGNYNIILLPGRGLTCPQASQWLARFLQRPDGRLPRPWVLEPDTATFRQGRGSSTGFRVDPAAR